jgi:phage shock protein PspC (stress-responsive transcriptional regulator)
MTAQTSVDRIVDPAKAVLNKRLESVFWGLFLIMLGGWALIPAATIPKGAWSIGVGFIMLGLNAARYLNRIRMSGFTTVLGILAVVGGVAEYLGWDSLNGALILIILGAYLILKPWFEKQRLFGKAEEM